MTDTTHSLDASALARRALRANALFSATAGILLATAPHYVPGIHAPSMALRGLGLSLVVFAGWLGLLSSRARPPAALIVVASALDLLWVFATPAAWLATGGFDRFGIALSAAIALVVLACAVGQLAGVRRLLRETTRGLGRWRTCVAVDVDVAPAAIWRVISDLGSISRYLPELQHSTTQTDTPGVGTVRSCTSTRGETWSEACTAFDEERRSFEVRFLTDAPGFPWPMEAMFGGWRVEERPGGCRVVVWWSVTPKTRLAPWLLVAAMGAQLDRQFPAVIARMASAAQGSTAAPGARSSWRLAPC